MGSEMCIRDSISRNNPRNLILSCTHSPLISDKAIEAIVTFIAYSIVTNVAVAKINHLKEVLFSDIRGFNYNSKNLKIFAKGLITSGTFGSCSVSIFTDTDIPILNSLLV